jgi:copper transport protein
MRWLHRAAVLAAVWFAVASVPVPASAHAYLAASTPADGAVLAQAPAVLTLSFTEHVELEATRVTITDGDGRGWAVPSIGIRAADESSSESPVDIIVTMPTGLPPNVYHVAWSTLSSDDLHATTGTLVFGLGRQVVASGPAGPAPPGIRESIARAVVLIGTSMAIGGAVLAVLLGAQWRLRRRLLRVAGIGGAVALVGVPLLLAIQVGGTTMLTGQLSSTRFLLREGGLVLLTGAVWWLDRRGRFAAAAVTAGGMGAVLTSAGTALSGHPVGGPLSTVLAGGVHVLAAGAWAGSVIAAAAALLPRAHREPAQLRPLLLAFGAVALGGVLALGVTGLVLAGAQVSTWDALLTSPYGLLLLVKVAAMVVAGLVGLRTSRRLRRPGDVSRRRLMFEGGLLVVVLALAGTLASAGPARGPRFPVASAVDTQPQVSGQAADLVDTLAVRPNRPGRNVVSITVDDTRRPAPAPITGVSLQLVAPDGTATVRPVNRDGAGWTAAIDDIRAPGTWRIGVTVLRQGLSPATDLHSWEVPATDPAAVVVSAQPVRPVTTALAVVIGAGSALALLAWWLRRRYGFPYRRSRTSGRDFEISHRREEDAVLVHDR